MAEPNAPRNNQDNTPNRPQVSPWYTFLWLSAAILVLSFWLDDARPPTPTELAYSEFKQAVTAGHVDEVTLRGDEISGRFTSRGVETWGGEMRRERFHTISPPIEDQALLSTLEEHGVTLRAEPADPPWWQQLLLGVVPWILLLALLFWFWFYAQRRFMQGGGPFSFGQSRARRFRQDRPTVTMDDVAGIESAKRDLMDIVDFLKHPEKYRALGAKMPKGILMVGPPGTGKTLMARAVAGEADVPFFSISASEFVEMYVGVGASRVRDMFKTARQDAPALIFIDELDSVGRSRGAGLGGGHDEREQTLNQILTEMDGFEGHESVIVLAATNRPDVLDNALLRPGRFDRKVILERPHREARKAILQVHVRNVPLAEDVDLDRIAARTTGFAGADLQNLVNEAALIAARHGLRIVDSACFNDARDKIVLGDRREAKLTDDEKEVIAYHECGHAIMAYFMPHADELDRVTIIPRGMALGLTEQTPSEERYNLNESYLKDRIKVMLGGRAAEKVVYGQVSSGAENDLKQVTKLVRRMVAQWGMSEKLGPVGLSVGEEHVFLGREMAQPREHSERLAELIDEEIRTLLGELEDVTEAFLREHRRQLDILAKAVLDRETLSSEEIRALLEPSAKAAAG